MRVHRPDDDAELIWVAATHDGDWLVRVRDKYTEVFLRPRNRGLLRRGNVFGQDHHADAVLFIKAKQAQEWEAM